VSNQVTIGKALLILGDCYPLLKEYAVVDALITDPPYGMDIAKKTGNSRNRWNTARRSIEYDFNIIGDDRPFDPKPFLGFDKAVLFGGNHFCSRLPDASCWLVWDKRDGSTSDHQADCEMAWTNLPGPARLYSQKWRGMIRAGEENLSCGGIRQHPAQKPVALLQWVIEQCKLQPGATIFDPFMGSGSLGVAAVRGGFNYVGIELDPVYYERACQRISDEQRQERMFA
jgi:site-specific DNA-methyltransferase (adenine-specific)